MNSREAAIFTPVVTVTVVNNQLADGTTNDVITVTVTDGVDPVTGLPIPVNGVPFSFQISGTSVTKNISTGDPGYAAGTVTYGLASGTVSATDIQIFQNGNPVPIQTVTFNYIAGPPSPTSPGAPTGPPTPGNPTGTTGTLLSVVLTGAVADGTSAGSVKAHITDANGHALANVSVTLTIVPGGDPAATADAKFTNGTQTITGITDAAGNVLIPGYTDIPITDKTVGDVWVSASIDVNPGPIFGSPAKVTFVVGPPVPVAPSAPTGPTTPSNPTGTTGTLLSVELSGSIADGVEVDSVKAHITDAAGHPLANVSVTLTIVPGGDPGATANAKFSNGTQTITGITDAAGNVLIPGYTDIPITDITMGIVWISASIDVNPGPIFGSPAKVKFVAGPPVPVAPGAPTGPTTPGNPTGTTGTFLTITQDYATADGVAVDSVKAHITDKFGNQVGANVAVTFTITNGGTLAAGVAQIVGNVQTITLLTDANGNIEAGLISPKDGTVSINAYIFGSSIIDGSAKTVTFVNKPDVTNPETKLIVIVYQAMADGTSITVVKAHVVDQNGVPLPGQDVTFAIDSGSATIITPQPVTTDLNGEASIQITSKKAGFVLITATVGGQSITFGSPARVKFVPINIYVPPVFTPNGDGNNDVLKPILVGIATFHYFSVYNRWGNLIFTTEDPNTGWDGRFKGVAQPVETYLWIAEGIDMQGNKIVQKGMTTLVR
jgi:gliding motility-associated-like protein